MMLIKDEGLAGELIDFLVKQADLGCDWVVYNSDQLVSGSWDLHCFEGSFDAMEFAWENQQIFDWHIAFPLKEVLQNLKKIEFELKNIDMNRNSLENFRAEATALKVPQSMVTAAESMMEQGIEKFTVKGQVPADVGMIDISIHMKKSGQSDYYYLNRFDIAQSKAKILEKDHQYIVISPDPAKKDSNLTRKFDSAVQAMDYFREQKGNSELAMGKFDDKNLQFKDTLSTMKDGKIDYVKKEFQQIFYSPVLRNSHYIDRGKGFSVEQAANMLQGRAVFREDMVSRAGEQYKAWSVYQFDQPKDKYGNYTMKQFGEGYGFDLKKELSEYRIKDIDKQEVSEPLITAIQNGNRPLATVTGLDGKDKKLLIEAVPRYTNLNFFETNGKPVKREELKKEQELSQDTSKDKSQDKEKNKQQESSLSL